MGDSAFGEQKKKSKKKGGDNELSDIFGGAPPPSKTGSKGTSGQKSFPEELAARSLAKSPVQDIFTEDEKKFHKSQGDVEHVSLEKHDILLQENLILRNASVPVLVEKALQHEQGSALTSTGALMTRSGVKTGRSPKDKRIVFEDSSCNDVWWGRVNIKLDKEAFMVNRERAIDYLSMQPRLFVIDAFAGHDPDYRIKIRVICSRGYHALFMRNMLIMPTPEELLNFGEPDYTIFNAGQFPANRYVKQMTSSTSISFNLERREITILGSQYAGEMKKGCFTLMNYLMPKRGVLSLHSSANESMQTGETALFFGLSGTGKTTLSADPHRYLIGDDEHVWTDKGIFNIEGGCYAKCINLRKESEPDIFNAIKFGAVVENTCYDTLTREVDYDDSSITENTRCSYPLQFIPNHKWPAVGSHPKHVILLTCDAFGVLPPVSKLTTDQVMYHFISGYTAKMAGTEVGVKEPQATFSSCFGEPFLVWHPIVYARLLAKKLQEHKAHAWLVNTGWTGGESGKQAGAHRMSIKHTRSIVTAILDHKLNDVPYRKVGDVPTEEDPFQFEIPLVVPPDAEGNSVSKEVLLPEEAWVQNLRAQNPKATKEDEEHTRRQYRAALVNLAKLFTNNFKQYEDQCDKNVIAAGPKLN